MSLYLLHLLSACFMTGVIWFVHLVHYPLFARVGEANFAAYEAEHQRRTGWVVIFPMLLELATGILIAFQPSPFRTVEFWIALALLVIVWIATFAGAVPQHAKLSRGFNATAHKRLLRWDLARAIAWTLRTALLAWPLYAYVKHFLRF